MVHTQSFKEKFHSERIWSIWESMVVGSLPSEKFGAVRSDSHSSQKALPSSMLPHLGSVWRAPCEHERQEWWLREPQRGVRNPFWWNMKTQKYISVCSGLFEGATASVIGLMCLSRNDCFGCMFSKERLSPTFIFWKDSGNLENS